MRTPPSSETGSTGTSPGTTGTTPGIGLHTSTRYDFGTVVVRGRTGALHRGLDTPRDRPVFLKLLRPPTTGGSRNWAAIQRKVSTLRDIDHPHVADVRDFGRHHGLGFVVSDAVQGMSLASYLDRFGPLSWVQFAPCLRAILEGLAVVHQHGIVAGDVQPSHIILTREDESGPIDGLQLLGFGFPDLIEANQSGRSRQSPSATDVDAVAPEWIEGRTVDQRTDLYALGEMVFHMLAGRPPFTGDESDRQSQHLHDDPPPLADQVPGDHRIPDPMFAFVETLLAKAPDDRPNDAGVALKWFRAQFEDVSSVPLESVPLVTDGDLDHPSSSASEPGQRAASRDANDDSAGASWTRRAAEIVGGLVLFVACAGGGWYAVVGFDEPSSSPPPSAEEDAGTASTADDRLRTETLFAKIDNAIDNRRFSTARSLLERLDPRLDGERDLRKRASRYTLRLRIGETFERAKRLEEKFKIPKAIALYRQILTVDPGHDRARNHLDTLVDSVALQVTSNVKGAVYVDGRPVGVTPMSELVSRDASTVSVRRRGYEPWSTDLEADGGQKVELQAELTEATAEPGRQTGGTSSPDPQPYGSDMLMNMDVD